MKIKQAKLIPVENNYLTSYNKSFGDTLQMVESEHNPAGLNKSYSVGYINTHNNRESFAELFTIEWREETNNYIVLIWNSSPGNRNEPPDAWETECGPYKNLSGCFQKIFNTWNQIKLENVLESVAMEEFYKEELELESNMR